MARLLWENSNIGNVDLQNLQVARDSNDRVYLRFNTKTRNDNIYNFVDEARQSASGVSFSYNDTSSDSEFVNDIMDNTCDYIERELKSLRENEQKTANISPILASAVEDMRRVYPKQLTITGYSNEVIIIYEVERA